jgi:hypothetical protein
MTSPLSHAGAPPSPPPSLPIDLTSWRVSAGVRAQRITHDIGALSSPSSPRAQDASACVEEAIAVIARSQKDSRLTKLARSFGGSDVEHAWQLLKQAEENLMLAKSDAELLDDVPWLCEVARLSYEPARADDLCATIKAWNASTNKPNAGMAAEILRANHAQSNAAHEQTRGLRNLLYLLTLLVFAFDLIVWRLGLDFATVRVLVLGALGGALAMVFVFTKGSPVAPYNVAVPQLLLKVVSGGAVAVSALLILNATFKGAISEADALMYALIFGFSQQLFTQLVDNRAAVLKEATAPKAP